MVVGFVLVSGHYYLFFLLKNTVFKGRLGPDIDEYGIYHNRKVETAEGEPWPVNWIDTDLTEQELQYNKENGTEAFLVIQDDKIRFEYTDPNYNDTFHYNIWSASKSIVGLLIGCAIDDGFIPSLDEPISKYFPGQYENSGITIRHVLMMSSGINFTESYINPFSYAARGLYDENLAELNKEYEPVVDPGVYFDYQSGNSQLLGMILTKATGKTVSEYASEKLWKPMHAMEPAYWSLDGENGMERSFCCFNTNIRDFARFGKLMLHNGVWNGDTLVNPEYAKLSTRPADLKYPDGTECKSYGLHWWTLDLPQYQGFYARGLQGQYIFVLPAENLIIVRMGHDREIVPDRGHITDVFNYIDMGRRIVAQAAN